MAKRIWLITVLAFASVLFCSPKSWAQSGITDQNGRQITCASDDGRRHHCDVDTSRGVQMTNQRSGSACVEGQTWGTDRGGIWVDRGCRADFLLGGRGRGWGNGGGQGWGNNGGGTLTCSSDDGGRHYCNADTTRGVQMTNQRSGSSCVQGQTWGYDRRGVWVDRGCRADFSLGNGNNRPGWGNGGGQGWGNNGGGTITCSSDDGGRHYCNADTNRGVRMVNQRSGSACVQGQTWGYDRRGIWVDRGCRADFEISGR